MNAFAAIQKQRGFGLVEVLLAIALLGLLFTIFAGVYLYGQESSVLAGNRQRAVLIAEEGLEAVRNIRDEGAEGSFEALAPGTYGLAVVSGQWAFAGSSDTTGIYTRQIVISDVDTNRKDVVSTVSWQQNAQRTGSVAFATRLTNWQVQITPNTIFNETFPSSDGAWNGSSDTAQDEPSWVVYQGSSDSNDVQVSNEDSGSSPSGGSHLTFEEANDGFQVPEQYDIAYVPINLEGYTNVTVSYYWQSDDVDANEGLRVAYSTDTTDGRDGIWTPIAQYINPTDNTWTQESFNLPDGDAVATFVLRFSSLSNGGNEHMYVDDILVTGYAQ